MLTLEQMHFADEVEPPTGVVPARLPSVSARELQLATSLIENSAGNWKPTKYKDTYTDALLAAIRRKAKGEEVHRAPETDGKAPTDLMEALRASVEASKKARRSRPRPRARGRR
jgi:DNA end-binding protein Ku